MRLSRLFLAFLYTICPLFSFAETFSGTISLCPGQTQKVWTNSSYSQNDGFNPRWIVEPSFAATIISESTDYCIIRADQLEGFNVNLYFKYDCYMYYPSGVNQVTVTQRWILKHKDPPSYELKATPSGGSVEKGTKVTLTLYADGSPVYDDVSIKYTLNGSDPSLGNNGTKYTSAGITINEDCTLWAKATRWQSGCNLTETYTIAKSIEINATNFPDENFRNYLLEQDYGKDGILSDSELKNISELHIDNRGIENLNGIDYFTGLKILYCSRNNLKSLDLSKNKALTTVICSENQLTNLNVSKNVALTSLDCGYNSELTSIDVSKNTNLQELNGWATKLSELDVTKNTKLTKLSCSKSTITSLDLTKNLLLEELSWEYGSLVSLNFGNNKALSSLQCRENQITSLDLSNCTQLETLWCDHNQLTSLILPNSSKLTSFWMDHNLISGSRMDKLINSLPTNNTNEPHTFRVLFTDKWSDNACTTKQVAAAKAKGWTPLWYNNGAWVEYEGSEPATGEEIEINSTNFPDENFRNYLLSQIYGKDGILTAEEIKKITTLWVEKMNIRNLRGIEFFMALEKLYCRFNQLISLDVSKNTALTKLDCFNNQLTSLDVSNTALTYLSCYSNQIKGVEMDNLISSLPQNTTNDINYFRFIDPTDENEGNVCTKAQVTAVKAKGWFPCYWDISAQEYKEYKPTEEIKPERISLPETATVVSGQTITLTPGITPADAETTLTWASDDETIATVDANGVVTGVKKGMTFITVKTDNGLEAFCELTVTEPVAPEPTALTIPDKLSVSIGQKMKIDYTLTPKNAATTISWTISKDIASIDADGFITGKAEGLAVVKATTANGLTSNSCRLTVTAANETIGDVNGDGKVDIVDVTMTISQILGQKPAGFNKETADMNGDKKVDIVDVTSIIDMILKQK